MYTHGSTISNKVKIFVVKIIKRLITCIHAKVGHLLPHILCGITKLFHILRQKFMFYGQAGFSVRYNNTLLQDEKKDI